ncbi:MAG: N-acetylmuramoyl-L-alanine amidase [Thermodesulfobacteriota bacterium]
MNKKTVYLAIITILLFHPYLVKALLADMQDRHTGTLKTVVIDPGHGGLDSGAIGPNGIMEKDINLAIAKRLSEFLSGKPGLNVILTRTEDIFIPLRERTAIANGNAADLFVSIHANAAFRKGASGVETYFLSFEASDDEARRVAAFENGVVSLEDYNTDRQETKDDLKAILWDMAQTELLNESSQLAELIQEKLSNVVKGEPRGVKQAPFIVLVGATMPAILIEVGFITNPEEEKRLASKSTQEDLASAVFEGINNFEGVLMTKMGFLKRGTQ